MKFCTSTHKGNCPFGSVKVKKRIFKFNKIKPDCLMQSKTVELLHKNHIYWMCINLYYYTYTYTYTNGSKLTHCTTVIHCEFLKKN